MVPGQLAPASCLTHFSIGFLSSLSFSFRSLFSTSSHFLSHFSSWHPTGFCSFSISRHSFFLFSICALLVDLQLPFTFNDNATQPDLHTHLTHNHRFVLSHYASFIFHFPSPLAVTKLIVIRFFSRKLQMAERLYGSRLTVQWTKQRRRTDRLAACVTKRGKEERLQEERERERVSKTNQSILGANCTAHLPAPLPFPGSFYPPFSAI